MINVEMSWINTLFKRKGLSEQITHHLWIMSLMRIHRFLYKKLCSRVMSETLFKGYVWNFVQGLCLKLCSRVMSETLLKGYVWNFVQGLCLKLCSRGRCESLLKKYTFLALKVSCPPPSAPHCFRRAKYIWKVDKPTTDRQIERVDFVMKTHILLWIETNFTSSVIILSLSF